MIILVLLFAHLLLSYCDQLILVQVVFRHGDRAPMGEFTSKEADAYYFRGREQITNKGLDQSRELGLSLKRRYIDIGFADSRYIPSEVVFRSSASERCLMTASAVASAMFNETESGHAVFVPVYSTPKEEDLVCYPRLQCPLVLKEMAQLLNLKGTTWNLENLLEELFAAESKRLNYTHVVGGRLKQFEQLFLEHESGLAVPQWFNEDARREADHLLDLTIEFMAGVGAYHNRVWIQTRSGKLLSTILENMREATELKTSSKKIVAFSTHDVIIAALLDSMGILRAALDPQGRPSFVSTIVFELWKNNDNHQYVKVLYRRGPGSEEFRDLSNEVKGCRKEKLCSMEDFSTSIENYTSDDPAALCLIDGTSFSSRNELECKGYLAKYIDGLDTLKRSCPEFYIQRFLPTLLIKKDANF